MRTTTRLSSILLTIVLLAVSIPLAMFTSDAAWEIQYGGSVSAGQTATLICQGDSIWQQTDVIFQSESFTIAHITAFDPDGKMFYEKEIFESYFSYSEISLYGGTKYLIEVFYGSIQIRYNTANVIGPTIECQENGNSLDPLVGLNESSFYIRPGQTQELWIEHVQTGFTAIAASFSSDNPHAAKVDKNGMVSAVAEGNATIKVSINIFRDADNINAYIELECSVYVVDDEVDIKSGLRFYYSEESIEVGDTVLVGASYTFGDVNGMIYPGTIEWEVSNPEVLSIVNTLDDINIARATIKAHNYGTCILSLVLDGEIRRSETIIVAVSEDTLLKQYKQFLIDNAVINLLSSAQSKCWEIISDVSAGDRFRMAFTTCLGDDLGLKVITKEFEAMLGLTSSYSDDALDEAVKLLMNDYFSVDNKLEENVNNFKKNYENIVVTAKVGKISEEAFLKALEESSSFEIGEIKQLADMLGKVVINGMFTKMELTAAALLTAQYERNIVCQLMNILASTPGGSYSDLYKGLNRLLRKIDDLDHYAENEFISDVAIDGLFLILEKIKAFETPLAIYELCSCIGSFYANVIYRKNGGLFADDYLRACYTYSISNTLYNALINSQNSYELHLCFDLYSSSVKVALDQSLNLVAAPTIYYQKKPDNNRWIREETEGYFIQVVQNCTYEKYLEECKKVILNSSKTVPRDTIRNGRNVREVYKSEADESAEAPETKRRTAKNTANGSNSFYDSVIGLDKTLSIPAVIDGVTINGVSDYGFSNSNDINGLVLPDSIEYIGKSAFSDCSNLSYILTGSKLTTIGEGAFSNCNSLIMVDFSDSIEQIDAKAFSGCSNLNAVVLKENISSIGAKAFENCYALQYIEINGKNCSIDVSVFDGCSANLVIYGYKNTDAESIANLQGFSFIPIDEDVSSIEISSPANKTVYEFNESLNTDGMAINVTYMDGTIETITGGWVASCDTSTTGNRLATVYFGGKKVDYYVQVNHPQLSISISDTATELFLGSNLQLTAVVQPYSIKNLNVHWVSSNEDVVRVNQNGFIEAFSVGDAVVTAYASGSETVKATCRISVIDEKEIASGSENDYIIFTARKDGYHVFRSSGSSEYIIGSILDKNGNEIASQYGIDFRIEYRLHKGCTYIFRTNNSNSNCNFTISVNESVPATGLLLTNELNETVTEIINYPDTACKIKAQLIPDNYLSESIVWESDNPDIASVSEDGYVTFASCGETSITARTESGLVNTCKIIIKSFDEAPEIRSGENKKVFLTLMAKHNFFKFVPEKDGWFYLYSLNDQNRRSHAATLLDANGNYLAGGISYSASLIDLRYQYHAGETYIFKIEYVYDYYPYDNAYFTVYLKGPYDTDTLSLNQIVDSEVSTAIPESTDIPEVTDSNSTAAISTPALYTNTKNPAPTPSYTVTSESDERNGTFAKSKDNNYFLIVGLLILPLIVVCCGVVIIKRRKKSRDR